MQWLSDDKFNKFVGLLRLQHNEVFKPFKMYGMDAYIPGAIEECVKLAIAFSEVMRGKDKPISIEHIRRKK